MITVSNLGMQFGGQWLFQHVDLQFLPGNCYGIIGANGAGKSTFLRILTGDLDSTTGSVEIDPTKRVSVLKQNQNAYDDFTVMDTVIMGNKHLYDVMKEKDAIYEKPDFTDEDGLRAADLEAEFAELGGWEAESDASRLLQGLGIGTELHYEIMGSVDPRLKVKVLLAQALFGNPDIVMLDEPTNNLDIEAINWLEDFLLDFPGMVIAVSHDRHFLNEVCTYIADIAAATRRHGSVKLGLSTRGAVALKRMACALAMASGRDYAMPQDVIEAAPYVVKHRLICRGYSGAAGGAEATADEVLRQVLDSVPVPTEG